MTFDTSQMSYQALRGIIAERTNGAVFWVGSGPSVEAGLPSWSSLKNELLKALAEKIANLDHQDGESLRNSAKLVRGEQNNWRAFQRLRQSLGSATWQSSIREALGPSTSAGTPSVYQKIWSLRPHGILTMNLDRLVTKAYTETNADRVLLAEFVGKQVAQYTHVLKNPHPFVCHLHGQLDDSSSWIMTSSDLAQQKKEPSLYKLHHGLPNGKDRDLHWNQCR